VSISPVGNAYTFKSLANDTIMIGDVADAAFHPKFTLNRWHGECWLKLEFDDSQIPENQRNVNLVENKVKWSSPLFDFHFYPVAQGEQHEDGGLEFEIVLKSKPLTNRFSFPIQTQNLVCYFQPPLNQELDPRDYDILTATEAWKDGKLRIHRPERMVGSYAVYHNSKSNNQYKTGKAFHLPIPEAVDAIGNRTFGSYNTDVQETGVLTVTLPQEFLDSAVYPITIDPTFGYTSIGASVQGFLRNYASTCKATLSEAGTVTTVSIYCNSLSAGADVVAGIYDDNGGSPSDPNNLKTTSSAVTVNTTPAWREFNVTDVALAAGAYHLGWNHNDASNCQFYYDSGDTGQTNWKASTYPNFPDPFGTPDGGNNNKYSIYATYTTGATIKTVTDSSSLSDSVLRNKTFQLSDALGLADIARANKTLAIADSFSLAEVIDILTGRNIIGEDNTSSVFSTIENTLRGSVFTMSEDGLAVNVKAYLNVTVITKATKAAIYRHSDLALIGATNQIASGTGVGWRTMPFATPVFLSAGVAYVIVVWQESTTGVGQVGYNSGDTDQGHVDAETFDNFPDPMVPTHDNNKYCVYAEYNPFMTVADVVGLGDGVLRDKTVAITDSLGISDMAQGNKAPLIVSDAVSLTELINVITGAIIKMVADAIGVSDTALADKVLQVAEDVSLAEVVYVGAEGAKKTRLFLIVGDLAVQLTGE
jgi:hypothetical protein